MREIRRRRWSAACVCDCGAEVTVLLGVGLAVPVSLEAHIEALVAAGYEVSFAAGPGGKVAVMVEDADGGQSVADWWTAAGALHLTSPLDEPLRSSLSLDEQLFAVLAFSGAADCGNGHALDEHAFLYRDRRYGTIRPLCRKCRAGRKRELRAARVATTGERE